MLARGQLLQWSGCRNARDVGGLPTRDGGRVLTGALLRTDSLDRLDAQGVRAVRDVGPVLVLDLRWDHERAAADHPLGSEPAYRAIPFIDPAAESQRDGSVDGSLADRYCRYLDRNGAQIAQLVGAIAAAPEGPVVVHCASGKDRTGLLVALLLRLVGVPEDVVCDDYARSEECLQLTGDDRFNRTRPETMAAVLAYVDRRWGGPAGYLADAGVSEADLAAIRRRLVAG